MGAAWYLHLFAPEQPDLNWENPEVRADFEDVLRFWFDRGVDGFRIDVAHGLAKDPAMPDAGERDGAHHLGAHPAYDQDAVHEVYRGWRAVANSYADKVFVAEAWVPDNERLSRYLRPDELHTAFQFDFLRAPWRADLIRAVIDDALAQAEQVGAPATWVLSNHDVPRVATRYARSQPEHPIESEWERARWAGEQPDLELGRRRARAAALLQLALPGTAYVYQGEELGLEEFEDLPHDARQDPTWVQSQYTDVGRDGCRIPLPFSGDVPPYGFSVNPDGAAVAAAAGGVGCAQRCRAGGRPDVDAGPLPGGAAVAARAFRRRRTDDVARRAATACSRSVAANSNAGSTPAPRRLYCRRATCCWARTRRWRAEFCRRTRRSGCGGATVRGGWPGVPVRPPTPRARGGATEHGDLQRRDDQQGQQEDDDGHREGLELEKRPHRAGHVDTPGPGRNCSTVVMK